MNTGGTKVPIFSPLTRVAVMHLPPPPSPPSLRKPGSPVAVVFVFVVAPK